MSDEAMFWIGTGLVVIGAKMTDAGHPYLGIGVALFGIAGTWLSRQRGELTVIQK